MAPAIADRVLRGVLALALCSVGAADAADEQPPTGRLVPALRDRLLDLSIEDLATVQITSVSRRAERLSDAAASVFVITGEDIRRAGVTTLPEALRLAPNLQVARNSASDYLISARGFNGPQANKLLVLIDGRSVYTPLFSGVFWDVQDVLLEDVERIEVISGPGGTLWGVNAVNGVINVITRSATDTQDTLLAGGAGNREAQAAVRHGRGAGNAQGLRLYAKTMHHRHTESASGAAVDDAWHHTQVGFRGDWVGADRSFRLHGNAYDGKRDQPPPGTISTGVPLALDTISVSGANLLGRWERLLGGDSSLSVQAYYDHTRRVVPPTFGETLHIVDLQVEHALRPAPAHAVVWGGQYRHARDDVDNSVFVAFLPAMLKQDWASVFAQDEITLRETLWLTLGARLERNDYTGTEFLPNARLAWKPSADHLVWGAVSRTVRAPSRLDRDTFVPGQPPFVLGGGPNVRSEIARVYELGYRGQPTSDSAFSATIFHADYDHLRIQQLAPGGASVFFGSGMEATVAGIEMWGSWRVSPRWRLKGGFNRLWQDFRLKSGPDLFASVAAAEGANPRQSWTLRSSFDLGPQSELDLVLRYVSALSQPAVPSYVALDLRLGWRLRPDLEFSLVGQNLLDRRHPEFNTGATPNEIQRAFYAKVLWIL
jgi:iron complex outermembrane recepter protein